MRFFVDTADIREITPLLEQNLVDGITTNPSLLSRIPGDKTAAIQTLVSSISGPVSVEVVSTTYDSMLDEAYTLRALGNNVCVKLPITRDGLKVCRTLRADNIPVNMTLCFSIGQALVAAKMGATFISPFIGRLLDVGVDGFAFLKSLLSTLNHYPSLSSEVLCASVRSLSHIQKAAELGCPVITVPPKLLQELIKHPLTDKGLAQFTADWNNASSL